MKFCKYVFFWLFVSLFMITGCSSDDSETQNPVGEPDPEPIQGGDDQIDWTKTFGGTNEDNILSIVQATDGSYVLAGYTQSIDGDITDKSATDSDYWVLKLSQSGAILWSKTYGGTADDRAEKIIKTNDGGYALVGYSRSLDEDVAANAGLQDYWIVKINAEGNILWEKNFGFSGIDRAFSLVQTQDGGYFITGFLDVTASGGEGDDIRNRSNSVRHGVGDFWGIKLNASGEKEWRRYFGGSNNDRSYDVVQTQDGDFIMIGSSESVDFDVNGSKGSYDFWAVKIDAQGLNILWEKSFGGSEIDVGYAIVDGGDGKFLIVGDSRSADGDVSKAKGNADLWVIQIDGNGNLIWEKSIGGTEFDTGRSISKMQNGNYIITGNSRSSNVDVTQNRGQSDALSVIINNNGEIQWKIVNGGSKAEFGEGCIETSDKKIVIVGNSESSDFDIPNNKGSKDALIIKYK